MAKNFFSDEWTEITPETWKWIMWDNANQEVIGWIYDLREEEFTDKNTGETRTNLVAYMVSPEEEYIRFIVPTDLRLKIDNLNDKRIKAKLQWSDILIRIIYNGKVRTSKGYEVKTFRVQAKKGKMPKKIADNIPDLPSQSSIFDDDTDLEIEGFEP